MHNPDKSKEVAAYLAAHPGETRADIAMGAGILLQSVCPTVYKMIERGEVEVMGNTVSRSTGRRGSALRLTPAGMERHLYSLSA